MGTFYNVYMNHLHRCSSIICVNTKIVFHIKYTHDLYVLGTQKLAIFSTNRLEQVWQKNYSQDWVQGTRTNQSYSLNIANVQFVKFHTLIFCRNLPN